MSPSQISKLERREGLLTTLSTNRSAGFAINAEADSSQDLSAKCKSSKSALAAR